jgi:hypothetical protein
MHDNAIVANTACGNARDRGCIKNEERLARAPGTGDGSRGSVEVAPPMCVSHDSWVLFSLAGTTKTKDKTMKSKIFAVFAVFLLASADAQATKPIMNIEDHPVAAQLDGTPRSLEQVRDGIIAGCKRKGWNPVIESDTQVKCSILVRGQHYAEVKIPFSVSTYSIIYSNSRVLDYNPERQRIHRNYNKWVILLSRTIDQQFTN